MGEKTRQSITLSSWDQNCCCWGDAVAVGVLSSGAVVLAAFGCLTASAWAFSFAALAFLRLALFSSLILSASRTCLILRCCSSCILRVSAACALCCRSASSA